MIGKDYTHVAIAEIMKIKPLWHQLVIDIDFTKEPDPLIKKYAQSPFHIYKSSLAELKATMLPMWDEIYGDSRLWTEQQQPHKINRILENWENGITLIPPSLTECNGNLFPAEGKHRLKLASFFNPDEIYFILFDVDLPAIKLFFSPIFVN